jgi:hypothetical protein
VDVLGRAVNCLRCSTNGARAPMARVCQRNTRTLLSTIVESMYPIASMFAAT